MYALTRSMVNKIRFRMMLLIFYTADSATRPTLTDFSGNFTFQPDRDAFQSAPTEYKLEDFGSLRKTSACYQEPHYWKRKHRDYMQSGSLLVVIS